MGPNRALTVGDDRTESLDELLAFGLVEEVGHRRVQHRHEGETGDCDAVERQRVPREELGVDSLSGCVRVGLSDRGRRGVDAGGRPRSSIRRNQPQGDVRGPQCEQSCDRSIGILEAVCAQLSG